jgi:hypothetical protein
MLTKHTLVYNDNLDNYRTPGPAVYGSGQQGSGKKVLSQEREKSKVDFY